MDKFSPDQRRDIMSRVKSSETKPELAVRRIVYSMGYRYRLHRKDLPGKPDLAFFGRKMAIFVHGCFWHQHPGCKRSNRPSSNQSFWDKKLDSNVARDKLTLAAYDKMGWKVFVVWECETKNIEILKRRLKAFLDNDVVSPLKAV